MRLRFVLVFAALVSASCSAQSVLNVSRREAGKRLAAGDIGFIVKAPASRMGELARIHPSAPFYAALLLAADDSGASTKAQQIALLNEALKSPVVREAAFQKLIPYNTEMAFNRFESGFNLNGSGVWIRAFRHLAAYKILAAEEKTEPSRELLSFFFDEPLSDAHRWLNDEISTLFDETPEVWNLVDGRFFITRLDYGAAWRAFRGTVARDAGVFIAHPELLSDLGRALQYSAPQEGLKLFAAWENTLGREASSAARYRLLFFAGRMARSLRKPQEAMDFFAAAAAAAPDGLQKDACIWYLLDIAYGIKEENLIAAAKKWAPQWHDAGYFSDIFDKFAAAAAKNHHFGRIREAFFAISDYADTETRARYAYITGRALEYGLLTKRSNDENAAFFYNIAYSDLREGVSGVPAVYYRALAAARLERPLNLDAIIPRAVKDDSPPSPEMDFFDGFFRFGAAKYAASYVRARRDDLSIADLRRLAEKFDRAGEWQAAINLTLSYMSREGYRLTRRDLELRYPRGFCELVERNAERAGLRPALLFGLVRRESVFNPAARSRVGAAGLTQLMKKTGTEMARQLALNGGPNYAEEDGVDLFDAAVNLHLGALYYRQLIDMTKSPTLATLAYNGGIGRIRRWRRAAQDLSDDLFLETVELNETRNYGRGVLGDEIIYTYLYY